MMFVMIVVYLHIFMEKCDSDTKYHNSTFMIDNVCKIVLLISVMDCIVSIVRFTVCCSARVP